MELNKDTINEIIRNNQRFISVYSDHEPYDFYSASGAQTAGAGTVELYYEKLRYAVKNADSLISGAFNDDFFNFYGVDKTVIPTPQLMCSELLFDSFVMNIDDQSVAACLSNPRFMFGHFIEVVWDKDWNIISVWID